MKIESKRFGSIEVREDRILQLKGGLLGFGHYERFVLLDDQEDPNLPFKWLVAVDDPEIGFLVTDPGIFFKDYIFEISEGDRKDIGVEREEDVQVIVLLTVPKDPKQITANLVGPVVVNSKSLQGKQIILEGTSYATKHYIFLQTKDETTAATAAANQFVISAEAAASELAKAANNTEVKTTA